jgi:heat shock protein HslJ
VPGTRIRLDFKDGGITARIGCNTMSGEFRMDGGRLVLGQLATTAMGCDAARSAQDAWLSTVLGARPAITLVGDQLTIDGGGAVIQLTDRRIVEPDLTITGPTWIVDSIFSGETVSSVPQGAVATLVFHADGTLEVDTGCNTGQGRWQPVGAGIDVSDLGLTKKGCAGAAGELERAVILALGGEGTIAAAIQGNQLILRGGGGGIGLRGS